MPLFLKRTLFTLAALAVAAMFYWALRDQPVPVDTAHVVRGPMAVTIDQEGVARVRDIYTVSSPISGHLSRTTLEVGDAVKAGTTVIAAIHPLDPPLIDRRTEAELQAATDAAHSAVELAKAEVKRMQAELGLARSELERATKLSESSTISQRALERASADVTVGEAQLASARATVALREAELASAVARQTQSTQFTTGERASDCCIQVTAPIDGTVLEIMTKSEQAVSPGTQIAKIGNPQDLELVADFLSADAVHIIPGQRAAIIDWGGDGVLQATVRRIDPAAFTKVSALGIEEQRVNVILDMDKPEPSLGDGFRIYARIAIWQSDDVVQVPLAAIFRSAGSWTAFRVTEDKVELVPLEIGHMNSEMAEVVSGLAADDIVVVHPSDTLSDGGLVTLRDSH